MSKQKRLETRYAWIEASLRYAGRFEKVSYGNWFDINAPQISADQAGFVRAMNHECMHREKRNGAVESGPVLAIIKGKIAILRPLPSTPVFEVPKLRDWLKTSASIPFVKVHEFDEITPPEDIMRDICEAIMRKKPLRIAFATPAGTSWRDVSPHSIIDASGRLHVRAFDHLEEKFSDFALSRVSETGPHTRGTRYFGSEADIDWRETSEITLEHDVRPNPERVNSQDTPPRVRPVSRRISIPRALSRFLSRDAKAAPTDGPLKARESYADLS